MAALVFLTLVARAGDAQYLRATELSAGAVAALASRPFYGAGLGLGRRSGGQLRPAFTAAGGRFAVPAVTCTRALAGVVLKDVSSTKAKTARLPAGQHHF